MFIGRLSFLEEQKSNNRQMFDSGLTITVENVKNNKSVDKIAIKLSL